MTRDDRGWLVSLLAHEPYLVLTQPAQACHPALG